MGISDDATCEWGDAKETVTQFLLKCPKFDRLSDRMRQQMRMEKLLGNARRMQETIEFIAKTRRLHC
jgi:hypothetical protein